VICSLTSPCVTPGNPIVEMDLRCRRRLSARLAARAWSDSRVARPDQLTQPSPSLVVALLGPAQVTVQTEEVDVLCYIARAKWA
jgi:hypothetical protein